jgi:serine protease Do
MIRKTLAQTKAATLAVSRGLTPIGTGFFVSPLGVFVTSRHVIADETGALADLGGFAAQAPGFAGPSFPNPTLIRAYDDLDVAILRVDLARASVVRVPYLRVSERMLDEGEPVYSYGLPLPLADKSLWIELDSESRSYRERGDISYVSHKPRITSAVVASHYEEIPFGIPPPPEWSTVYVIDKPLIEGNSGGPIVATDTGHVHAVVIAYQPARYAQDDLRGLPTQRSDLTQRPPKFYDVVMAWRDPDELNNDAQDIGIKGPSPYGIVARLSDPRVLSGLEAAGVPIVDD